jgi:hypothetical protein
LGVVPCHPGRGPSPPAGVLILHHARAKEFSDPAGKTWHQWRPEARDKLWSLTHKWADVILFGGWSVAVNADDQATGEERSLRTGTSGAIVAGSRYGLPDVLRATAGGGEHVEVLRRGDATGEVSLVDHEHGYRRVNLAVPGHAR